MAAERRFDDLWYSSPIQVFEEVRDATSKLIDVAATLIQLAQQYRMKDANATLSTICRDNKTRGGRRLFRTASCRNSSLPSSV
jgi:hypothetical protein